MQASLVLRSAVTSKGFLIPPRTSWDLFQSAGNAILSLMSSQGSRTEFDTFLRKGTIQQDVLGRAGQPMGTAMILSLYNDLNSPVLQKYGFDTVDFLEGVKPALREFHNVHCSLINLMYEESLKTNSETDDGATKPSEEDVKKDRQAALMAAMVGLSQDPTLLRRFSDWNQVAGEDTDSMAARLKAMVTAEFFGEMQRNAQTRLIIEESLNKTAMYEEETAEVSNVALLSARTMVLEVQHSKEHELDMERLKHDELSVAELDVDDRQRELGQTLSGVKDRLPVAAQVEVLYEVKKSMTLRKTQSNENDDDADGSPQTTTDVTVLVAVLEGWINGDPDGKEEPQWRLVSSRFPWEFSSMNTY